MFRENYIERMEDFEQDIKEDAIGFTVKNAVLVPPGGGERDLA